MDEIKTTIFETSDLSPEKLRKSLEIFEIVLDASEFYGTKLTDKQASMWSVFLSDIEPAYVKQSVVYLMKQKTQVFMPKPAEIMDMALKFKNRDVREQEQRDREKNETDQTRLSKEEVSKRVASLVNKFSMPGEK